MDAETRKTSKERFDRALERLRQRGWKISIGPDETSSPRVILPVSFDDAFTRSGELIRDLTFGWEGTSAYLQAAFAREGLVARVSSGNAEDDMGGEAEDEDDAYDADEEEEGGQAVCLAARIGDSDLCRIDEAFGRLRALGYTAEPAFAWTSSMGWGDVHPGDDGEVRAVFWTTQSHDDTFDADGDLVSDLSMQWAGDPQVIAAELAPTGLVVIVPESTRGTFTLKPSLIRYELKPDVTRTDVHDAARELGWIYVEISADDGRPYEEVWTTDDGRNTIRYVEDPSAPFAHLIVTGEEAVEVTDDIAAIFEI